MSGVQTIEDLRNLSERELLFSSIGLDQPAVNVIKESLIELDLCLGQ